MLYERSLYINADESIKVDHIARSQYTVLRVTNLEIFTLKHITFSSPQSVSIILLNNDKENSNNNDLNPGESLHVVIFIRNIEKFRPKNLRVIILFFESEDQTSNVYLFDSNITLMGSASSSQLVRDLEYFSIPYVISEKLQSKLNETEISGVYISELGNLMVIANKKGFLSFGNLEKITRLKSDIKNSYFAGRTLSIIDDLLMIEFESNNIEILRLVNELNSYLEKLKVPIRIKNPDFDSDLVNNKEIQKELLKIDKFIDDNEKSENKSKGEK